MNYIQSDKITKLPHHFDAACAYYGAIDSCQDCRLTTFEEVESGKFDMLIRNNFFAGSVEFMREVFKRINIEGVGLPKNSNRKFELITLKEARNRTSDGTKLFIKPYRDIKLFSGTVLDGVINTSLANVDENTKVMAYEPFESRISSEWRAYIHMNRVVDIRQYSGEIDVFPDMKYVKEVIDENKLEDFPIAYTIDVGILENGTNVVIEFNDMWAIGNYGMENDMYYRMLRDRYFEIVRR